MSAPTDPWYHQTYKTADEMEAARPTIQQVMGQYTDATLEYFKTRAGRADRAFDLDFGDLLDNILQVSFTDLHPSCVMTVSKAVVRKKHQTREEWMEWIHASRARSGAPPINFTDS